MRVGQIRLEDDPGIQIEEVGLVEHPLERLERQLEVAVLLHVEVDEDRWRRASKNSRRRRSQTRSTDCSNATVESWAQMDGCLHRDVRDVGAADPGDHIVEPAHGFRLAEHGLAEHVHVDRKARPACRRQVASERRLLGGRGRRRTTRASAGR